MSAQTHDLYYENPSQRSPSHRQPSHTVQRQSSRPFDGYSTMPPNGLFPPDEHAAQTYAPRYTDRMNATINPQNPYPSYDTWGAPQGFNNSQMGPPFATMGAGNRMNMGKMGRGGGRAGIPSVCLSHLLFGSPLICLELGRSGNAWYSSFRSRT